jgi:hypothetical protein
MGSTSIDHYAGLEIGADTLRVKYLLDFAEVASVRELDRVDPDMDSRVTPEERENYLTERTREVLDRLRLEVNGEQLPLESLWSRVVFLEGTSGGNTVRIAWELVAKTPAPLQESNFLRWNDRNHPEAPGWQEIRLSAKDGLGIGRSSLPDRPEPGELGDLPDEIPRDFPRETSAWCQFGPGLTPAAARAHRLPDDVTTGPDPRKGRPDGRLLAVLGALGLVATGVVWVRRRRHP